MSFHTQLLEQTAERPPGPAGRADHPGLRCAARSRCPATWPSCARPTTTCAIPCRCCRPAKARAAGARTPGCAARWTNTSRRKSGHEEWILDDIRACGGDAEAVRHGPPGHATEVMVAYAYDTIARRNPLGFFGMVHVLEGTSVSLALLAADAIQKPLALPDTRLQLPALARHAGPAAHGALRAADGPRSRTRRTRPPSCTPRAPSSASTATSSAACRCRSRGSAVRARRRRPGMKAARRPRAADRCQRRHRPCHGAGAACSAGAAVHAGRPARPRRRPPRRGDWAPVRGRPDAWHGTRPT